MIPNEICQVVWDGDVIKKEESRNILKPTIPDKDERGFCKLWTFNYLCNVHMSVISTCKGHFSFAGTVMTKYHILGNFNHRRTIS